MIYFHGKEYFKEVMRYLSHALVKRPPVSVGGPAEVPVACTVALVSTARVDLK
jgi:hypothetical protein